MMDTPKPDIIAVLEAYGAQVRNSHGWVAIRCPFHGDSNASASVNADFGKFNCHGCDVHGDAWDLIMAHEGCELKEAIEIGKSFGTATYQTQQPKTRATTTTYKPLGRRGRK
jgi:DNA primase